MANNLTLKEKNYPWRKVLDCADSKFNKKQFSLITNAFFSLIPRKTYTIDCKFEIQNITSPKKRISYYNIERVYLMKRVRRWFGRVASYLDEMCLRGSVTRDSNFNKFHSTVLKMTPASNYKQ